jgi:hypothetical protein
MSYFFQECNKSFKIYWISENLIPKSSSNFALSQLSVLSAARGIVRARNLDVLRQLNLPGAVLSIGNRLVYFASEKNLTDVFLNLMTVSRSLWQSFDIFSDAASKAS